jgi:hypothetical protein
MYCDGSCENPKARWSFADDFYCCKFCFDVQFCRGCLDKLRSGKLQKFVCSDNHEWLHVPKWDDERYLAVGKRKVRIRGQLVDGARVGGEDLSIKEWLDIVKTEWGIIKEEKKSDEGVADPATPAG